MTQALRPTILLAGFFANQTFEGSFCNALRRVGANVAEFPVGGFFGPTRLMHNVQDKFQVGPGLLAANLALVQACRRLQPDILIAWTASWLRPWAMRAARKAGAKKIAVYNIDDPFGPDRDRLAWRRFRETIPYADTCFTVRKVNFPEYLAAGAKHIGLLPQAFDPAFHHPIDLTPADRAQWASDVVFIGHCENDSRLALMDRLLETNLKVGIYGQDWERFAEGHRWSDRLPIRPLHGLEYLKAIAAAKIALVFTSTRNRDDYTYRCFEIPAIGTMMLAPRTPGLLERYQDGAEVAFYSGPEELVGKAQRYVNDDSLRNSIAVAGRQRAISSGYDIDTCARRLIEETLVS